MRCEIGAMESETIRLQWNLSGDLSFRQPYKISQWLNMSFIENVQSCIYNICVTSMYQIDSDVLQTLLTTYLSHCDCCRSNFYATQKYSDSRCSNFFMLKWCKISLYHDALTVRNVVFKEHICVWVGF